MGNEGDGSSRIVFRSSSRARFAGPSCPIGRPTIRLAAACMTIYDGWCLNLATKAPLAAAATMVDGSLRSASGGTEW